LDLDDDKDGFIQFTDILRYFGDDDAVDVVDLKALMRSKSTCLYEDSSNCGLNCKDFTNWLGESIHQREGFFFRHDSMKNPAFNKFIKKREIQMKDNKVEHKDVDKLVETILHKFAL